LNWWTHLLREERLAHAAPDTLSMDELVTLQATVLGKMMLVNGELHRRYAEILASFDETPSSSKARDVLLRAGEHLDALNHVLRDELALVLSEKHPNMRDDPD
jgi:hypothetical protein